MQELRINGQAITDGLRAFNEWLDEFLIEASTRLLMIGFVAGTVDVFTQGTLSTIGAFNISWAIAQAIALDGLFFAVWSRIARACWTRERLPHNCMLILVGLLLAIVAMMVNGILSYQELMSLTNVQMAMAHLHVDQTWFTAARSLLVVIVAIFVALFCRSQPAPRVEAPQESVAITREKRSPRRETTHSPTVAIPEQATSAAHSLEDVARQSEQEPDTVARQDSPNSDVARQDSPPNNGYVAIDDGDTVAIANGEGQSMIATGSHRDRIKQVMLQAMHDSREMTYSEIAEAAGAGYSTVKKWAPDVRKEIERARV